MLEYVEYIWLEVNNRLIMSMICLVSSLRSLASEVVRVIDEELSFRARISGHAIKDDSKIISLPPNEFHVMDDKATDYDDMRCCCVCNQACIFTAVACECDQKNVACVRHYSQMCRCTKEKRFMLGK